MRTPILLAPALHVLIAATSVADCDRPVAPPRPIVEMRVQEIQGVRGALERLAEAARQVGFDPTNVQWGEGHFIAVRSESDKVEHRVAVWLQWSINEPGRSMKIYTDYGRFRKYQGGSFQREDVSLQEAQRVLRPLIDGFHRVAEF